MGTKKTATEQTPPAPKKLRGSVKASHKRPRHEGIERLRKQVKENQAEIKKFAKRVAQNPYDAFDWISSYITIGVEIYVFTYVIEAYDGTKLPKGTENKVTPFSIMEYARNEIMRRASSGAPRSSGALAGDLHAETLRAWTRVIQTMEGW